jgi:hypothetical protein
VNLTWLWVALVYFAGTAVWRRYAGGLPWRVAIFFYLLVLVFLFVPMTGDAVNVPADYLRHMHPWRAVLGEQRAANPEINDVILQMVPWAQQVHEQWRSLEPPLWFHSAGGGYPLLANGQSAALSPLRLINLPLEVGQAMTAEAAMKLLIALSFTWLFARRRLSAPASLVAAVSFGFSSFLVVWLHFPHATVVSLLPPLFYGIDLAFERVSYKRYLFLCFVFAFLLVGGHPESAAHIVFAAGLYVLYYIAIQRRASVRPLLLIVGAGLTALALAAAFLLPFAENLPLSQRFGAVQHVGAEWHGETRWEWSLLVPLYQVGFYGSIRDGQLWGAGLAEFICGYGGILGWVGWLGSMIVVVRRRLWSDWRFFFVLLLPLMVGIALNWPLIGDAFARLPLFSMAANGRMRLVVCWAVAILAGCAVDLIRSNRRTVRFALLGMAVALVIPYLVTTFPTRVAWEQALGTGIMRGVVLALALLATFPLFRRRLILLFLLGAVTADLWSFGRHWNPTVAAEQLYPSTPLLTALDEARRVEDAAHEPFRINGMYAIFFPNASAMYGLEDVRAHDPMTHGLFVSMLDVLTGYTSTNYFGMMMKPEHPLYDFLNVRYVVSHEAQALDRPEFREIYSGPDGRLYRNEAALRRFFQPRYIVLEHDDERRLELFHQHEEWTSTVIMKYIHSSLRDRVRSDLERTAQQGPAATIRMVESRPTRHVMEIGSPGWAYIASSVPNMPGWKAYREGERLTSVPANEAFVGFFVPPGSSRVEVVYRPLSFSVGASISLLTLGLLLIAPVTIRQVRRQLTRPEALNGA